MLTEKKQVIADLVREEVYSEIYNDFINLKNGMGENSPRNILDTLHNAIARGVAAGVKTALDHIYTTEEFEQDIGLK